MVTRIRDWELDKKEIMEEYRNQVTKKIQKIFNGNVKKSGPLLRRHF